MKKLTVLTYCVTSLLVLASGNARAADRRAIYYTFDTVTPMTDYQVHSLCQEQTNTVQKKLTEVSARLTGQTDALQVVGRYGRQAVGQSDPQNPQYESFCYLEFVSLVSTVGFNSFSAVHYTHLNNDTWDTACKPVYDTLIGDENTLATNYIKTATLFQGRICEVTTVNVEKIVP